MHRTGGIGNGALCMLALLFDGTQGSFEIARIVHSVEYAKDIDAIYSGALDEFFHDIIGVVPIAQQVLASQQHLLTRVGHGLLEFANALPRVFSQVRSEEQTSELQSLMRSSYAASCLKKKKQT